MTFHIEKQLIYLRWTSKYLINKPFYESFNLIQIKRNCLEVARSQKIIFSFFFRNGTNEHDIPVYKKFTQLTSS